MPVQKGRLYYLWTVLVAIALTCFFAKINGIELYRLQPNATHFLQPLDNRVLGPLKKIGIRLFVSIPKKTHSKVLERRYLQLN